MNYISRIPASIPTAALLALLMLPGCFNMIPMPGQDFHKAAYSMEGSQLMVRNDDHETWHATTVTLDTDQGYFRQKAGELTAGDVRQLPLDKFTDPQGRHLSSSIRLKSVWIHATYSDGRKADELAFPAETFGLAPVRPKGS